LSFDVEDHHRVEAAAQIVFAADTKADSARMEASTRRILDQLAAAGVTGGLVAPAMSRSIAALPCSPYRRGHSFA
jgi:hypothetical protein